MQAPLLPSLQKEQGHILKYTCLASKRKMVCITLAIFFLLQKPKGTAKSLQGVSNHFLLLSTKTM